MFCFYSFTRNHGAQPIARSPDWHRRDAGMSRGIVSEIYQLLGEEPDENADGRVRSRVLNFTGIEVRLIIMNVPITFNRSHLYNICTKNFHLNSYLKIIPILYTRRISY